MTTSSLILVAGHRYVGTVTGVLNGKRVYREVGFTAARNAEPEPFIRDRETTPDQDRVFVVSHPRHPDKHEPRLYVTGSIRSFNAITERHGEAGA